MRQNIKCLHCQTDFQDSDTENELHNVGLKNKDIFMTVIHVYAFLRAPPFPVPPSFLALLNAAGRAHVGPDRVQEGMF